MAGDTLNDSSAKGGRCPICTAPSAPELRPFCSRRCADLDLSRWLSGAYAIAGREEADEDGDTGDETPPEGPGRTH